MIIYPKTNSPQERVRVFADSADELVKSTGSEPSLRQTRNLTPHVIAHLTPHVIALYSETIFGGRYLISKFGLKCQAIRVFQIILSEIVCLTTCVHQFEATLMLYEALG